MSHRPAWTCKRCCYVLGEVVAGAVVVRAPRPMIGADSTAIICPRCDFVNVWSHKVATTAPVS